MKTIYLVLFASMLIFTQACTNSNSQTNKEKEVKTETVVETKTEHKGAIHITKDEFLTKVMNFEKNPQEWVYLGDKPCIIDFYADWCRPCKIAGPILDELAVEYKDDIYVYKVDTEKERELAAAFGIQSIPAFLFCPKEGNPQMSNGIARTNEETKAMFKGIIDDFLLNKETTKE